MNIEDVVRLIRGFEPYLRHLQAAGTGGKIRDDVESVTFRLCGVLHSRQIVDEQDVCSLLERNPVVAQGQRHRAGRDISIYIRMIEKFIGPCGSLCAMELPEALEAFPGFHVTAFTLDRNRIARKGEMR